MSFDFTTPVRCWLSRGEMSRLGNRSLLDDDESSRTKYLIVDTGQIPLSIDM